MLPSCLKACRYYKVMYKKSKIRSTECCVGIGTMTTTERAGKHNCENYKLSKQRHLNDKKPIIAIETVSVCVEYCRYFHISFDLCFISPCL